MKDFLDSIKEDYMFNIKDVVIEIEHSLEEIDEQ